MLRCNGGSTSFPIRCHRVWCGSAFVSRLKPKVSSRKRACRGDRPGTWASGVAAAALVAAIMLPGLLRGPVESLPVVPDEIGTSTPIPLTTLQTLMTESRDLESNMRALPSAPRVQRASTMATISDLEDRIAAIDYQLNDPSVQMSDADRELFWRERVRLMKSLLQLRYAQAQRAAF